MSPEQQFALGLWTILVLGLLLRWLLRMRVRNIRDALVFALDCGVSELEFNDVVVYRTWTRFGVIQYGPGGAVLEECELPTIEEAVDRFMYLAKLT